MQPSLMFAHKGNYFSLDHKYWTKVEGVDSLERGRLANCGVFYSYKKFCNSGPGTVMLQGPILPQKVNGG